MEKLHVPEGATVYLGRPARPMPPERLHVLARLVSSMGCIEEAHVPQCFVPGIMKVASQVLVIVGPSTEDLNHAFEIIEARISRLLSPGEHLDVLPLRSAATLLDAVRRANCRIFLRHAGDPEASGGLRS